MSTIAVEQPIDYTSWARRLRYPLVLVTIGAGLVTLLAIIGVEPNGNVLDPRSTRPDGAHALSVLLSERGTQVSVVSAAREVDDSAATTVLVADPSDQSSAALRAIAATHDPVVLVDPGSAVLRLFGMTAAPDATTSATTLPPACTLPAAVTAGAARIDGDLYAASSDVTQCYPATGDAALLAATRPNGASTYALGSTSLLSNAELASQGDAALALGLLDNDHVDWVPTKLDTGPAATGQRGLFHLLPSRLLWAVLQLLVAMVLLALWRGRRLGSPVVEPLPVVVRATETTEGRARLLQAAQARGAAANALRRATIRRLARALQLGTQDTPDAVIAVVAERTGRSATDVQAVLYGGEPADDPSLVSLAQELPRLEAAVRNDSRSGGQP